MGKLTIPRVANALWSIFRPASKMLIVVDADNDPGGTVAMLTNGLEFGDWASSIPNPSIETWLGLDLEVLRRSEAKFRIEQSQKAAQQLDIADLKQRDKEFARLHDAILWGLP
jgi:hypothetical protein